MRRYGYRLPVFLLVLCLGPINAACTTVDASGCRQYGENEMGKLATLVRVTMDITSSAYMGEEAPVLVPEEKIRELIRQRGTPFKELELLDKYELVMVSHEGQWAAVAWNPRNDQKLLQDLRCTKTLDDASWRACTHGNAFTLDWRACN